MLLVISNWPCAVHSAIFEITPPTAPCIVLQSVQLLLLIIVRHSQLMYRDTYLNMKIIIKFILQLMYRDTYLNMKILLNLFYSSCMEIHIWKKRHLLLFLNDSTFHTLLYIKLILIIYYQYRFIYCF